jgi:hypothetical protein
MTTREIEIAKELLDTLKVASPTLLGEPVLHGNIVLRLENSGKPAATRDEFEAVLRLLDGAGAITSVRNVLTQKNRWTITDQGLVTLRQM